MQLDIMDRIRNAYPELSSAKKTVASYFLTNYTTLHFSNLAMLAERIGVSDTTIINFCYDLGFSGFSGFKSAVRDELFQGKVNDAIHEHQLEKTDEIQISHLVNPVFEGIQATFSNTANLTALSRGAELIASANKIYAVGFWTQATIAQEFCLRLRRNGWNVEAINPSTGDYIDKALHVTSNDVVVAYDFAPYFTGMLEICQLLSKQEVPVVLVTDTGHCPCLPYVAVSIHCSGIADSIYMVNKSTTAPSFHAGSIVSYVLRSLACSINPKPQQEHERLREGIFPGFNPYGVDPNNP